MLLIVGGGIVGVDIHLTYIVPSTNNKTKQLTFRCPHELLQKLEAKRDGRNLSEVILEILEANIDSPLAPKEEDVLGQLVKRLDQLEADIFDAIAELRQDVGWVSSQEELEKLSETVKSKLHLGDQSNILRALKVIIREKCK